MMQVSSLTTMPRAIQQQQQQAKTTFLNQQTFSPSNQTATNNLSFGKGKSIGLTEILGFLVIGLLTAGSMWLGHSSEQEKETLKADRQLYIEMTGINTENIPESLHDKALKITAQIRELEEESNPDNDERLTQLREELGKLFKTPTKVN